MEIMDRLSQAWLDHVRRKIMDYYVDGLEDDREQTDFGRISADCWRMLRRRQPEYFSADRSRQLLAQHSRQDPEKMSYGTYLRITDALEKYRPSVVETEIDSCLSRGYLCELVVTENRLMLITEASVIYSYNRWSVKQLKKNCPNATIVLNDGRLTMTTANKGRRRKQRNRRRVFTITNVESGQCIDEFDQAELNVCAYKCKAMKDDVLVVADVRDGRLKLKLRWFETKKMAQYIVRLAEPFTELGRKMCLKDGNLVVHLTNCWATEDLIEVRPLDRPDRVSFRIESDCLSQFLTAVDNLADLFDENKRICEPMLRHFGFTLRHRRDTHAKSLCGQSWDVHSIHRNGKYLMGIYVAHNLSAFQMRLHAMGHTSTELVYVYEKRIRGSIFYVRALFADGQIIVAYNNRIVSFDFRSSFTQ